jgi:23S rRNA (cytosine1962-C5)-methyltransferase
VARLSRRQKKKAAEMSEPVVTLKRGKERAIRRGHPWVFSGAVADGSAGQGDTVIVRDHAGSLLGRAAYSPSSQIRARMWTFDDSAVDDGFIRARLDDALALRSALIFSDDTDCARLVFAENDGLPGLVVDRYADTLVLQCQSAGAERVRDVVVAHLVERLRPTRVYERSDADVRKKEGLAPRAGLLHGAPVAGPIAVRENGLRFLVDVEVGHKTGFYLDQRDSRARVRAVARGRRVLNCFSYTGGFAIAALAGGAQSAISVDTSMSALEAAERHVLENGIDPSRHEGLKGDCFDVMRGLYDDGERFDLVVLDPPKFAPGAAHVEKACRGYQDLAHCGLKLLNPGGLLFTFSCSGAVDRPLFRQVVAAAALDAGRPLRIVGELGHPADHPVLSSFPEGEYLKGFVVAA